MTVNDIKALTTAALFGTLYAALLTTDRGKELIDEYTTLGVVLGVGGVLLSLRSVQSSAEWRRTAGAFLAAGAPLVARGIMRKLDEA